MYFRREKSYERCNLKDKIYYTHFAYHFFPPNNFDDTIIIIEVYTYIIYGAITNILSMHLNSHTLVVNSSLSKNICAQIL